MDQYSQQQAEHLQQLGLEIYNAKIDLNKIEEQTKPAIHFHHEGVRAFFTLPEAQQVLPIIFKLTKKYSGEVQVLMDRLNALGGQNPTLEDQIEKQVSELIQTWQNKVTKLGALPKGLWLLDFDAGDGYFCWKYPARQIQFWHQYQDGFSKRVPIEKHLDHIL